MARLEVQVDEADAAAVALFSLGELDRSLDGERRIPDASSARQKYHSNGTPRRLRIAAHSRHAPSDDVMDFLQAAVDIDPVGIADSHQSLVIGRGDLAAEQDEEDAVAVLGGDVDQPVEIGAVIG